MIVNSRHKEASPQDEDLQDGDGGDGVSLTSYLGRGILENIIQNARVISKVVRGLSFSP